MRPVCLHMIFLLFTLLYLYKCNLIIQDKRINHIERNFQRDGILCADFLLGNILIRFGTKLYRQVVGIPIGTYCAPLGTIYFCFVMRGA